MKIHLTTATLSPVPFDVIRGCKLCDLNKSKIKESFQPYTLLSFAYAGLEKMYVSTWVGDRCEMILDSGAFTAWSAGKTVKIDDYLSWALNFTDKHRAKLKRLRYINLDVIPGSKGISATPEQLKAAAIASEQNALYLRTHGIDAIEVFHQDEPLEILKAMVDRANGNLIAISPRNDVSSKKRETWLKSVLSYCVKTFGKHNLPAAHGLAVTSEKLVYAYPFYSVDSSTWMGCLRFGDNEASRLPVIPKSSDSGSIHAHYHALRCEALKYQNLALTATKLWASRGINWADS